ncbi:HSP90 family protein [Chitinimonas viridis]|uniref:HSP90 family protein n=1 Tax=Chitinimonas viridis TaxID=664880 RepID=A0ABT8B701_9NEIS|nr:HSP90 family protein [Chitinimonas viridis]MDN3578049.1 HSP90 family protein [Chitinimonas viridis]
MDHRFQINLTGLIDLLSNHLYTRPDVFVRELMQNATDAIHARCQLAPQHQGSIHIHLDDDAQAVTFVDNGIGLTEAEMHRFLAVIGESSKRGEWVGQTQDYIGQFGIGLLACFIVADQIELVSRSAADADAPTLRWSGRPDGTYDIGEAPPRTEPGTSVRLVCKPAFQHLFSLDTLRESAQHYGGILPWPIDLVHLGQNNRVNTSERIDAFPWDASHLPHTQQRQYWIELGERMLGAEIFDAIPLESTVGGVDGIAFVLARASLQSGRNRHHVYLKRMLLSDSVDNLLPSWAFFVRCIVNCTDLHPTAARNAFSEDDKLRLTQAELGHCLRRYLINLAEQEPQRLQQLLSYHHVALKALALEDDEFFKLFAQWFPLETNYGNTTLQEYLKRNQQILYTQKVDEFRQIAQIAAAQHIDVINGGYIYDAELLARHGELFPLVPVRSVQPSDISHELQGLSPDQEARYQPFLKVAATVLEPFDCRPKLKIFEPADLPTLFISNREATINRQVDHCTEVADDLWQGVLVQLQSEAKSELCFNFGHTLIRRLAQHPDLALVERVIQVLYVQSLLMGHYPLGRSELAMMSDGLSGLLEWSVMGTKGTATWH